MHHDQRPEDQRGHLDSLPRCRAEISHGPVTGREHQNKTDTERKDADGIGQPESLLKHDVFQIDRMKLETEQTEEIPLDPTIKDDDRVYSGEKDSVDTQLSPPREPFRGRADKAGHRADAHCHGKQHNGRIAEGAVPSVHRAPVSMHDREGVNQHCGKDENHCMTDQCGPFMRF